MELIAIGKITTSFGIKGEVKVRSNSESLTRDYKHFIYIYLEGVLTPLKIQGVKGHDVKKIVKFDRFNSLNDVENLKNVTIFVDEKFLPTLPSDEFYYKDLLDKPCFVDGVQIGVVNGVRDYPQGLYIIVDVNGENKFIPFISKFATLEDDKIVITPIEGLL